LGGVRSPFLEIGRTTVSVLHSLIGRCYFLTPTLIGTIGVFLPVIAAHAEPTPLR